MVLKFWISCIERFLFHFEELMFPVIRRCFMNDLEFYIQLVADYV